MPRLLRNFLKGDLDASVTDTDTTLSSPGFADLPVVSSPDTMILVLDPLESGNGPEIATVTDHADGATTVTVTRGDENTTAASHDSGTAWIHAVTQNYLTSGNALGGDSTLTEDTSVHPTATANNSSIDGRGATAVGAGSSAGPRCVAIGRDANTSDRGTAVGHGSTATDTNSAAVGNSATGNINSVAIGGLADASGAGSVGAAVVVGSSSSVSGRESVSIGESASAVRAGIGIGYAASAGASGELYAIAIGHNASATGHTTVSGTSRGSIVVGGAATDNGNSSSIVIGGGASTNGPGAVVLGRDASADSSQTVAVGRDASAQNTYGVAVGEAATADYGGVAVGNGSDATSGITGYPVAVGFSAIAGTQGVAVGRDADSGSHFSSVALGQATITSADDQTHVGPRHIAFDEISDPATPPADEGRLYFRDDGSGTTELVALFPSGNSTVLATGAP